MFVPIDTPTMTKVALRRFFGTESVRPRRLAPVTASAGPQRKGAGSPTNTPNSAPRLPMKTVKARRESSDMEIMAPVRIKTQTVDAHLRRHRR